MASEGALQPHAREHAISVRVAPSQKEDNRLLVTILYQGVGSWSCLRNYHDLERFGFMRPKIDDAFLPPHLACTTERVRDMLPLPHDLVHVLQPAQLPT